MTPIAPLLATLESTPFRAAIDSLSSRRAALSQLQRDPSVLRLAAALATSPALVALVFGRMRALNARSQEPGTIHDYDATLAALAVAILLPHGSLRPAIEHVTHGAATMWLAHTLLMHRTNRSAWPSFEVPHVNGGVTGTITEFAPPLKKMMVASATSTSVAGTFTAPLRAA